MSTKRSALGRGFGSLIPTDVLDESFDPTAEQDGKVSDLRHIKLSEIQVDPDQPRKHFDELSLGELTESVREHGVLQPIVVAPHKGGYMIVAGERRYHAANRAGLAKIPALVRTLTNQHKLEVSLIENLQRRDLNPLETATAYLKLRDQFNLTLDEIGYRVGGKSVASISNTLRLLRLPDFVRKAIADGAMTEGQARPLINVDPETIEKILPKILKEDWSARAVERYVAEMRAEKISSADTSSRLSEKSASQYKKQVDLLSKRLRTAVDVKINKRGAGKLVISFKSPEDLERINRLINNS